MRGQRVLLAVVFVVVVASSWAVFHEQAAMFGKSTNTRWNYRTTQSPIRTKNTILSGTSATIEQLSMLATPQLGQILPTNKTSFLPFTTPPLSAGTLSKERNGNTRDNIKEPKRKRNNKKIDWSIFGLTPDDDGVNRYTNHCFNVTYDPSCYRQDVSDWLRSNVLVSIITGKESSFRVELSNCTWLRHIPWEVTYVVTDVSPFPSLPWLAVPLPDGVTETKSNDIVSEHLPNGYVREVRRAGQGYSASWIKAQFRFLSALKRMLRDAPKDDRWLIILDDDSFMNVNNLMKRLRQLNPSEPWYLSRRGWGGGGHIFSPRAAAMLRATVDECIDKWMVRRFHASDAMLLKCAGHTKLKKELESSMSHCPASHLTHRMSATTQVTMHAKKDFYPPLPLASWRLWLYYQSSYCRSKSATRLAADFSACAFGSCKTPGCTHEKDAATKQRWESLSGNNTIEALPVHILQRHETHGSGDG